MQRTNLPTSVVAALLSLPTPKPSSLGVEWGMLLTAPAPSEMPRWLRSGPGQNVPAPETRLSED